MESDVFLERQYLELCDSWPDRRVELINRRIVVDPFRTYADAHLIFRLIVQLMSVVEDRDWQIWNDITVFLGPRMERYRPDLTVVPDRPKMWREDHVYGDQTLLVVEVVSPGSAADDHNVKPRHYAAANAPLCLVIDPLAKKVRLLSEPGEKGYEMETEVVLGRALDLPEPWKLRLDTAQLVA